MPGVDAGDFPPLERNGAARDQFAGPNVDVVARPPAEVLEEEPGAVVPKVELEAHPREPFVKGVPPLAYPGVERRAEGREVLVGDAPREWRPTG